MSGADLCERVLQGMAWRTIVASRVFYQFPATKTDAIKAWSNTAASMDVQCCPSMAVPTTVGRNNTISPSHRCLAVTCVCTTSPHPQDTCPNIGTRSAETATGGVGSSDSEVCTPAAYSDPHIGPQYSPTAFYCGERRAMSRLL